MNLMRWRSSTVEPSPSSIWLCFQRLALPAQALQRTVVLPPKSLLTIALGRQRQTLEYPSSYLLLASPLSILAFPASGVPSRKHMLHSVAGLLASRLSAFRNPRWPWQGSFFGSSSPIWNFLLGPKGCHFR